MTRMGETLLSTELVRLQEPLVRASVRPPEQAAPIGAFALPPERTFGSVQLSPARPDKTEPQVVSQSAAEVGLDARTWVQASEALPELAEQVRHRTTTFLGGVAIRGERPSPAVSKEHTANESTLLAAVQLAALGDPQSKQVVRNNVATDIAERLFKAAHQTRVQLSIGAGRLQQNGRIMHDLHRNTLQETELIPEMIRRSKHELGNIMLFEALHAAGLTEHYDLAVFSPASTTMSEREKQEYRFYTDTETCSIQLLRANGNDVMLETALVAGKQTPDSPRHDIAAIQRLAARRGIRLATSDGTEMIGQALLIPKHELTGVETLVEWFDDAAGGTFYGLAEPRQNYQAYARERLALAARFDDIVQDVAGRLEASASSLAEPMDAIRLLDKLSAEACVRHAVHDTTIDTQVFGDKAALEIDQARFHAARGDFARAEFATRQAIRFDTSGSCPLRLKSGSELTNPFGLGADQDSSNDLESGKKKHVNCPYCRARVFIDPCAKRIECSDCHAKVVDGVVVSKGDGGSRARAEAAREAARATQSETGGHGAPQAFGQTTFRWPSKSGLSWWPRADSSESSEPAATHPSAHKFPETTQTI